MFKKYLIGLFLLASSFYAQASHLVTANVSWETTQNGQYIFVLELVKDCTGINFPATVTIDGPFGTMQANPVAALSGPVALPCMPVNPCQMEREIYKTAPVTLTGLPPTTGWAFSWSSCCFPIARNSSGSGFIYAQAVMYPYQVNGNVQLPNVNTFNNTISYKHSPIGGKYQFNLKPGRYTKADSVAINLATPKTSAAASLNFSGGYSANHPLPDSSESNLNGTLQFDASSGIAEYTINSAQAGFYLYAVEENYYKNGQRIATVLRNYAHNLYTNSSNNTAPVISINNTNYLSGNMVYNLTVGDTLSLDLTAIDLGQVIKASALGVLLDSSLLNIPQFNLPQITSLNTNGSFTANGNNKIRFSFIPGPGNLHQALTNAPVLIEFQDSVCPGAKSSFIPIFINVSPPTQIHHNPDTITLCNNDIDTLAAAHFAAGSYWSPGHFVADSTQPHTVLTPAAKGWLYLVNPHHPGLADSVYISRFDTTGFYLNQNGALLLLTDNYQHGINWWHLNGIPFTNNASDSLPIFASGNYWVESHNPHVCTVVSNTVNVQAGSFAYSNVPNPASLQHTALTKAHGFSFETNLTGSKNLQEIIVLGLMDANGKQAGGQVKISLFNSGNQLLYQDSMQVNNPNGEPLYFRPHLALNKQEEYRVMLSADSKLQFNMLQNASLPLSLNGGEFTVKQMLEASNNTQANTSNSTLMPAMIMNFDAPVSTAENKTQSLDFYPNPVSSEMVLSQAFAHHTQISIYSISGQLQLKFILPQGERRIDLQHLPAGLYLMKAGENTVKFVVE